MLSIVVYGRNDSYGYNLHKRAALGLIAFQEALSRRGLPAAQVLLTATDMSDRATYLNARNTLAALFRLGAVPVVNENDVTATDESGGVVDAEAINEAQTNRTGNNGILRLPLPPTFNRDGGPNMLIARRGKDVAFLPESPPRIRELRRLIDDCNPRCELEVDGGIEAHTLPVAAEAGATVLVVGTGVFGAREGPAAAVRQLRALAPAS